jgi:hypothetical protein
MLPRREGTACFRVYKRATGGSILDCPVGWQRSLGLHDIPYKLNERGSVHRFGEKEGSRW